MNTNTLFDRWTGELNRCFEALPDPRSGANKRYSIKDAAASAFSMFFTQSLSFLSHRRLIEKGKGRKNLKRVFNIKRIPTDAQIRNLLDEQDAQSLYGMFQEGIEILEEKGVLKNWKGYGGQILISMDGTRTVSSKKIHCEQCSQQKLKDGETLYYHQAVFPVLVKAGEDRVIVLDPEYITPQDGEEKQDCERQAAKRWVKRYEGAGFTVLGDDLYANQPLCRLLIEKGYGFIFVCKESSQVTIYEQVKFLEKVGDLGEHTVRVWNGKHGEEHHYRWANRVPMTRDEDALLVDWCEITITHEDTGETLYHNALITHHHVTAQNVSLIVRDGRARWKSEDETNNVLKTKGYNLEHNFGHGHHDLANVLTTLNLLAFQFHTLLDLVDEQYQALRQHLVVRQEFFSNIRSLLRYWVFEGWAELVQFMMDALKVVPNTS